MSLFCLGNSRPCIQPVSKSGQSNADTPVIRIRRPADHRSRAKRWDDDVASLVKAQIEYAAWLDSLPDSLLDSATAEALRAICELDLSELQAIVPPRGFGRD